MNERVTVREVIGDRVLCSCTTSACKSCSGNSFCNIKVREIEALKPAHTPVEAGDTVEIHLPPGKTIFAGFMVMILPLILFGVLYYLTGRILPASGEGLRVLGGLIGIFLGFGASWFYSRATNSRNIPKVVRVLEKPE
ncbi:SoxR reducing system RseC family protein [Marispirochaeta sp.]|jgi:positive regulator of sigma E activity|uniref:SoxR reducing system RseC family protein n=1 Tax=Marispirochaeta sp. TaxID=2038653 RepID=UPI0029C9095D|nr:SoxR reducing system RseC family protein [Marispirochaeta sp.]